MKNEKILLTGAEANLLRTREQIIDSEMNNQLNNEI